MVFFFGAMAGRRLGRGGQGTASRGTAWGGGNDGCGWSSTGRGQGRRRIGVRRRRFGTAAADLGGFGAAAAGRRGEEVDPTRRARDGGGFGRNRRRQRQEVKRPEACEASARQLASRAGGGCVLGTVGDDVYLDHPCPILHRDVKKIAQNLHHRLLLERVFFYPW